MAEYIYRIKKLSDTDFRVVQSRPRTGVRRMSPKQWKKRDDAVEYRNRLKGLNNVNTCQWKVVGDDFGAAKEAKVFLRK